MAKEEMNENKQPEEQSPTASYDIPICGPGTEIGHFRIEEEIGRGGMGVVYLAQDTKLDRKVAIKSIPPIMSKDEKVKARLKREAKLLASLDHPDIATIHDIIEGDKGIDYLVLEYIPGDTLADCIAQGPMQSKEVLSIGGQIADACASAHEHGIVHRDLKPANIKITKEDRVKVLDFGIAKAVSDKASNAYTTVTEAGQLIGTPAYMSPEQARGKPTDERCDIWSFGCVLYEMLTGKPPFEGETASDTLAGVLDREPDWNALPHSTPANVKVLVRRCLEKDPKQRLQHMGDVALEIRETVNLPAVVPPVTVPVAAIAEPKTRNQSVTVIVLALVVAAVTATSVITATLVQQSQTKPSGTIAFSIPLSQDEGTDVLVDRRKLQLAIPPDGKLIVMKSGPVNESPLYIRYMNDTQIKRIRDTKNAYDPFFSPDGQWLAFFSSGIGRGHTIWKTKLDRLGREQDISKIAVLESQDLIYRGTWSEDNVIFFVKRDQGSESLFQISANGGKPEQLSLNSAEYSKYYSLRALPDNKYILYDTGRDINLLSRMTGESSLLLENAYGGQYSHTGHLLFKRDGHLYAAPFDVDSRKITGLESIVINKVYDAEVESKWYFSISRNGTLAYTPANSEASTLVWVDPNGKEESLVGASEKDYSFPRLSPDENHIVFIAEDSSRVGQVWEYDRSRSISTRVTSGENDVAMLQWSSSRNPHICFSRNNNQNGALSWINFDTNEEECILPLRDGSLQIPYSWSQDNRHLAYCEWEVSEQRRFLGAWILPFENNVPGEPVLFDKNAECPMFCPSDDGYIAYVSGENGNRNVYIKEFSLNTLIEGSKRQISTEGGAGPCWSDDGGKLFYRSSSGMMEVAIETKDGELKVGESYELFDDSPYTSTFYSTSETDYDVASNGQFLMVKQPTPTQINVILNFDEELKRLAPTGK